MQPNPPVVDLQFVSVIDPTTVFGPTGTAANRAKVIEMVGLGHIDLPDELFLSPSRPFAEQIRRLVRVLQGTIQHLLQVVKKVEGISLNDNDRVKEMKDERDELFEEVVELRDALHYARTHGGVDARGSGSRGGGHGGRYPCYMCGNSYDSERALLSHMRKRHHRPMASGDPYSAAETTRDTAQMHSVRSELTTLKRGVEELLINHKVDQQVQRHDTTNSEALALIKAQQSRMDSLERLLVETTMSPMLHHIRREDMERQTLGSAAGSGMASGQMSAAAGATGPALTALQSQLAAALLGGGNTSLSQMPSPAAPGALHATPAMPIPGMNVSQQSLLSALGVPNSPAAFTVGGLSQQQSPAFAPSMQASPIPAVRGAGQQDNAGGNSIPVGQLDIDDVEAEPAAPPPLLHLGPKTPTTIKSKEKPVRQAPQQQPQQHLPRPSLGDTDEGEDEDDVTPIRQRLANPTTNRPKQGVAQATAGGKKSALSAHIRSALGGSGNQEARTADDSGDQPPAAAITKQTPMRSRASSNATDESLNASPIVPQKKSSNVDQTMASNINASAISAGSADDTPKQLPAESTIQAVTDDDLSPPRRVPSSGGASALGSIVAAAAADALPPSTAANAVKPEPQQTGGKSETTPPPAQRPAKRTLVDSSDSDFDFTPRPAAPATTAQSQQPPAPAPTAAPAQAAAPAPAPAPAPTEAPPPAPSAAPVAQSSPAPIAQPATTGAALPKPLITPSGLPPPSVMPSPAVQPANVGQQPTPLPGPVSATVTTSVKPVPVGAAGGAEPAAVAIPASTGPAPLPRSLPPRPETSDDDSSSSDDSSSDDDDSSSSGSDGDGSSSDSTDDSRSSAASTASTVPPPMARMGTAGPGTMKRRASF